MTILSHSAGAWYRRSGIAGLTVVGATGAWLSWESLYQAAATHLGQHSPHVTIGGAPVNVTGAVFSLLLDGLILASSLLYVAGVKARRPVGGWRAAAHAGIAGTVVANVAAAGSLSDAGWHAVAPIVWSLIVELCARDILGELREVKRQDADRIPWKLWLTSPAEQVRTSWRMLRTLEPSAHVARVEADRCAAASIALARTLPGARHLRTRRQITRRMWAGAITAEDVFHAAGWTADGEVVALSPEAILRRALRSVIPTRSGRSDQVDRESIGSSRVDRIESILSPDLVDRVESAEPIGSGASVVSIGSARSIESASDPIRSGVAARADDLARIREALADGRLTRSPRLKQAHVMNELAIGPTYARAAVQAIEAEMEASTEQSHDEQAEA